MSNDTDPASQIMGMAHMFWHSQYLKVAANLGLADIVRHGPKTPEEIAGETGTVAPLVKRLMRALASLGIFAEDEQGRFGNSPMSETLVSDHPSRMRQLVMYFAHDIMWNAFGSLEYAIRTGGSAFEKGNGCKFWDYHQNHPEVEELLADCMTAMAEPMADAIAAAYPFSNFETVVDVGGSNGNLIAAIVRKAPGTKGILFDLPLVIETAPDKGYITAPDVKDRISAIAGSAFEKVPEGHSCYIAKSVIHDWDDESCVKILRNISAAAAADARILLAEFVIQPGNAPDFAKLLDVDMYICNQGQERTEAEFRKLFAAAGLKLERIIPTDSGMSIVEGVIV